MNVFMQDPSSGSFTDGNVSRSGQLRNPFSVASDQDFSPALSNEIFGLRNAMIASMTGTAASVSAFQAAGSASRTGMKVVGTIKVLVNMSGMVRNPTTTGLNGPSG
jgi:hypothetical protein